MGGGNHGTKEDGATRMISWLYEKDALLYERASERDSKLGHDRLRKGTRARKIWSPNTQTPTNHFSFFIAVNIVSNLQFVVKVHKRKDKGVGIAGQQTSKDEGQLDNQYQGAASSDNRKYVAKKDEY